MGQGNWGGLGSASQFAAKCANCRYEYDIRSAPQANSQLGKACPNCGYLLEHQQMMAQQQMNTLSNQMAGGINQTLHQHMIGGMAGMNAGYQQMQQAMQNLRPNVVDDRVPELVQYENTVAAFKRYQFKEGTKVKGMFGLWRQRTELRIEIERLAKDLEHHQKNQAMAIAEAVQKERLKYNEEISKIKLECDKKVADAIQKNELAITQLQGKATRDKAEQDARFAKELAEAKAKAAEEYFAKMQAALTELHANGDKNSRFIQELALQMVKKAPRGLGNTQLKLKGSVKDLKQLEND